jgi:hypothetical protein
MHITNLFVMHIMNLFRIYLDSCYWLDTIRCIYDKGIVVYNI